MTRLHIWVKRVGPDVSYNVCVFFSLNKLTADKSTVLNYLLLVLGDKELKPVSFRVREAAEGLLTVIMEHLVCYRYQVYGEF